MKIEGNVMSREALVAAVGECLSRSRQHTALAASEALGGTLVTRPHGSALSRD